MKIIIGHARSWHTHTSLYVGSRGHGWSEIVVGFQTHSPPTRKAKNLNRFSLTLDKRPFFLLHFVDEGILSSYTDDHLSIGIASYKTCRSKITALQYIFIEFKNDKNPAYNHLPICLRFFPEAKLTFKHFFLIIAVVRKHFMHNWLHFIEIGISIDFDCKLQCCQLYFLYFHRILLAILHKLTYTNNNNYKMRISSRNIIYNTTITHDVTW